MSVTVSYRKMYSLRKIQNLIKNIVIPSHIYPVAPFVPSPIYPVAHLFCRPVVPSPSCPVAQLSHRPVVPSPSCPVAQLSRRPVVPSPSWRRPVGVAQMSDPAQHLTDNFRTFCFSSFVERGVFWAQWLLKRVFDKMKACFRYISNECNSDIFMNKNANDFLHT